MNLKTIGRSGACDLVLEHPSVSRVHARLELAGDGYLWLLDNHSSNGTHLQRIGEWIRVSKVSLCVADRIRFGAHEVPLERLARLSGAASNARLRPCRHPLPAAHWDAGQLEKQRGRETGGHRPRRNPVTGKIEDTLPRTQPELNRNMNKKS